MRACRLTADTSEFAPVRVAIIQPERRGVLEQLGRADASITRLADKFYMTLTGMKKHVGVLELDELLVTLGASVEGS
jgi:hypothetical protein